jgi:TetR/AcrR family transcriptional regulator, copper-responsive repressor
MKIAILMNLGRPREFELDAALRKAMFVFWTKGYSETSIDDLTEALEISRPSLYAAFGDKGNLFRLSLQLYHQAFTRRAISQLDSRANIGQAIGGFLRESVRIFTDQALPTGCLLELHGNRIGLDEESRAVVKRINDLMLKVLRNRYRRARDDGQLAKKTSPHQLTELTIFVLSGLSLSARQGASRRELYDTTRGFIALIA